jgi:hypothetical protein
VVEASVLIVCASPAPRVAELDDWLEKIATELDPDHAALYRTDGCGGHDSDAGHGDGVWFLALSDAVATSPRIRGLVAEMRLLGLRPIVYRPGSLPRANEGLARVF